MVMGPIILVKYPTEMFRNVNMDMIQEKVTGLPSLIKMEVGSIVNLAQLRITTQVVCLLSTKQMIDEMMMKI